MNREVERNQRGRENETFVRFYSDHCSRASSDREFVIRSLFPVSRPWMREKYRMHRIPRWFFGNHYRFVFHLGCEALTVSWDQSYARCDARNSKTFEIICHVWQERFIYFACEIGKRDTRLPFRISVFLSPPPTFSHFEPIFSRLARFILGVSAVDNPFRVSFTSGMYKKSHLSFAIPFYFIPLEVLGPRHLMNCMQLRIHFSSSFIC